MPALTKLTIITVTALEDCTSAVMAVEATMPRTGDPAMVVSIFLSRCPESFCNASLIVFIPKRKSPTAPSRMNICTITPIKLPAGGHNTCPFRSCGLYRARGEGGCARFAENYRKREPPLSSAVGYGTRFLICFSGYGSGCAVSVVLFRLSFAVDTFLWEASGLSALRCLLAGAPAVFCRYAASCPLRCFLPVRSAERRRFVRWVSVTCPFPGRPGARDGTRSPGDSRFPYRIFRVKSSRRTCAARR